MEMVMVTVTVMVLAAGHTFMINSGLLHQQMLLPTKQIQRAMTHLKVPRPAIPIPAFEVPYAAPTVEKTI
jgi:hypothetical protein